MKITNLMTREVRTCRAEDTLAQAAHAMWEQDCGCIPVVDERNAPIGIVTDRDACMAALLTGRPLGEISVSHAMTPSPRTIRTTSTLNQALQAMDEHQLHRLPVVDADGALAGIITVADILRAKGRASRGTASLVRTLCSIVRSRSAEAEPTKSKAAVTTGPKSAGKPEGKRGARKKSATGRRDAGAKAAKAAKRSATGRGKTGRKRVTR